MKSNPSDWYKHDWSLDIKNMSWVEDTESQVDFIIKTLNLNGTEKILDLACGYGRHALSFARRGYEVVGVDITKEYIEDAEKTAKEEALNARFILSDIRDVKFQNEYDVVLNMADGAIGYLENDEENLKIFDIIGRALKSGGKHFMDVCSAEHAEACFPKRYWEIGKKEFSFAQFEWSAENRTMLFAGGGFRYGETASRPADPSEFVGNPTRLYSTEELADIFEQRGMEIVETFSDYTGKEASNKELQLIVYSQKI